MTIQQLLDAGLPFLAALISYGLQQQHYSGTANTLIASVTILLAGGASVWVSGAITPDIMKDAGLIMAAATALQASALAPLQNYLKANFLASRRSQYSTQPLNTGSEKPLTRRASRMDDV
jgi:hypothetical protein